jgi:hypothetical protein
VPPETFLAVGHEMIQDLGTPMAILLPLALLSALVALALLWPGGRSAAFWWMAAGLLLMVAALVITLSVEARSTARSRTGRRRPCPPTGARSQSRCRNGPGGHAGA